MGIDIPRHVIESATAVTLHRRGGAVDDTATCRATTSKAWASSRVTHASYVSKTATGLHFRSYSNRLLALELVSGPTT